MDGVVDIDTRKSSAFMDDYINHHINYSTYYENNPLILVFFSLISIPSLK